LYFFIVVKVLSVTWLSKSVVFNTPIAIFSKKIKLYEYVNIVHTVSGKNSTAVKMAQVKTSQIKLTQVIMAQMVK